MEKNLFPIGRVVKPHGVKGKMKVEYYGDDLHRFFSYREILIEKETNRLESYEILEVVIQSPRLILRLKGIERIEEIEPLIGKEIFIKREALPELEVGEYYWADLLDMEVETQEGKKLGKVKEIFPTRAHDVYIVEGKSGEIFLPAIEGVIQSINVKKRVMKVARMEGLWEDEDEI
jgi:16S rRNA processing protein RimM